MEWALLLKFISAFVFVIALMFLFSWFLKRTGLANSGMVNNSKRRLNVVEFINIDNRRRLVLVRRDDKEHLLLLGSQSETVVKTDIPVNVANDIGLKVSENVKS